MQKLLPEHIWSSGSVWHKGWTVVVMEVHHLDVTLREECSHMTASSHMLSRYTETFEQRSCYFQAAPCQWLSTAELLESLLNVRLLYGSSLHQISQLGQQRLSQSNTTVWGSFFQSFFHLPFLPQVWGPQCGLKALLALSCALSPLYLSVNLLYF